MPQVPFDPVPKIQPTGAAAPALRVDVSPEAFGARPAVSLKNLSGAFDQASDVSTAAAVKFQQIQNEANVDDAYSNKFSPRFRDAYQRYYALQGKDAIDKMPDFIKEMDSIRQEESDNLPNPVQKHLFDQTSRRRVQMELDGMARYADQQNKVWRKTTSDSVLKSVRDQASDFWNDETKFGNAIGTGIAEIDRYATQTGEGSEITRARASEFISHVWADRIKGALNNDPATAQKLYDENKGQIGGPMRVLLEHSIKQGLMPVQARQIADGVMKDIPPTKIDVRAHLAEWEKEAEKRAQTLRPDDPVFQDIVTSRLKSYVATVSAAQEGMQREARNSLMLAALTPNAEGAKPTDLEQLLTAPERRAAWATMDGQAQIAVMHGLESNAKASPPLTEEGLTEYYRLRGMAANDPGKFINEDLTKHYGKMPHSLVLNLINQQTGVEKKAVMDADKAVAIAHAKDISKTQLLAAGIKVNAKAGTRDAATYDQFVGRLQQSLSDFYDAYKKKPTDAEIRNDIVAPLLVQGAARGTGWMFDDKVRAFQSDSAHFYVPVPGGERTKIVSDWKAVKGHEPTESEIRAVYTASQMKKK